MISTSGQRLPHEVYLILEVDAWVVSRGGLMGLGSRRVMAIGPSLLLALDVSQLRAVLAHELGHYHGGDVKLGPLLYHTRASIGRTVEVLHAAGWRLHLLFEEYAAWFLRFTRDIARNQELQADALAARIAGNASARREPRGRPRRLASLRGVSTHRRATRAPGRLPAPFADGFRRFMSVEECAEALRKAVDRDLQHECIDPFDTHPALHERIATLEAMPPSLVPAADLGPAVELLDDLDALEKELLERLLPGSNREVVAWEHLGFVYPMLEDRAAELFVAHLEGLTPATIPRDRSALVCWGQKALGKIGPEAAQELAEMEDLARVAAGAIARAILQRLIEIGWRLEVAPGRPVVGVRDDRRFDPFTLLQRLAAGEIGVWTWRLECERHGILDLPLGARARGATGLKATEGGDAGVPSAWTPIAWETAPVPVLAAIVATAPSFAVVSSSPG